MKVILQEELPGKGGEGDVVEVARGFANNYLLRRGMAVQATPGNLKQLEQRKKNIAKREEVRISNAEQRKAQLESGIVTVKARVGEEGQLFGSVTTQMIADAVQEQLGVEVDRRRIDDRQTIKVVGEHDVTVSIYREIKATVKLNVVDEAAGEEPEEPEEAEEAAVGAEAEVEADATAEEAESEEVEAEAAEETEEAAE